MARPQKEGLEYFPFDCGFFRDKKTRLVKAKFGAKGLAVLIQAFCEIYENRGYYMTWDEDDCLMMAETVGCGVSPELVSQVIEFSAARSLFDYTLFSQEQILTSRGIQKRFIQGASKRDNIRMRKDLFLLDENEIPKGSLVKLDLFTVSGEKTHVSGPETPVTGELIPKVKESIVKHSIVKDSNILPGATGVAPGPASSPVVYQLPLNTNKFYPITKADVKEWRALYPAVDIQAELRKMKGWLDANPKRRKTDRGIKRFINSWLSREQDRGGRYHQPASNNHRQGGVWENPFGRVMDEEMKKGT